MFHLVRKPLQVYTAEVQSNVMVEGNTLSLNTHPRLRGDNILKAKVSLPGWVLGKDMPSRKKKKKLNK